MFNLLVGFAEGEAARERVLEYTTREILDYVTVDGRVDPSRLVNLPTLVMPEIGFTDGRGARVGHIDGLTLGGRGYRFRFTPNALFPEIPLERIEALRVELGIDHFEFKRTHWAVKDADLYRIVQQAMAVRPRTSQFLRFPVDRPQEDDLVAVMMPFDPRFMPVYEVLREAASETGLRCHRADDIWEQHHIMDDVASLIWRARVVVADLTGKNPNVFYETGVAHSIDRDVIQIAQSSGDVPFDLRGIRSIYYHPNSEGLKVLKDQVAARLHDLISCGAR